MDSRIPSMITKGIDFISDLFVLEGFICLAHSFMICSKFSEAESALLDLLHIVNRELNVSPKRGELFKKLIQFFCIAQCKLYDLTFYSNSPSILARGKLLESNLLALLEKLEVYIIFNFRPINMG